MYKYKEEEYEMTPEKIISAYTDPKFKEVAKTGLATQRLSLSLSKNKHPLSSNALRTPSKSSLHEFAFTSSIKSKVKGKKQAEEPTAINPETFYQQGKDHLFGSNGVLKSKRLAFDLFLVSEIIVFFSLTQDHFKSESSRKKSRRVNDSSLKNACFWNWFAARFV